MNLDLINAFQTILTSPVKLVRFIKGLPLVSIGEAEDAIRLVTKLYDLQLDRLEAQYNHPNPTNPNDNLENDLTEIQNQLNQLRQHGNHVVKDVLQITEYKL